MGQGIFTDEDLRQIEGHGLGVEKVLKQLDLFKMPPPYLKLLRPCTRGDGIKVIDQEKMKALIKTYELEVSKRHCLKFVPASGAASRMFKTLLRIKNQEKDIIMETITKGDKADQAGDQEIFEFMNSTKKFAFFEDLKFVMSKSGLDIDTLLERGQFADIIRFLLSDSGLNYANLPKGLLKFHRYADRSRTAFEEHLVEAASYIANQDKQCFLHFTVSQGHLEKFVARLEKVRSLYEQEYQVLFHVTFSVQKKSTDTIAVGLDGKPFRDKKGRLLFRPGGHGSLIENVNDLNGDMVFIKNIDNVVPDRLKSETVRWKKILGGYLITLQAQISSYIRKLSSGMADAPFLDQLTAFVRDELSLPLPGSIARAFPKEKSTVLMEILGRPIRVCGMVRNEGEPGGGPFWVQDQTGKGSPQIVEKAQIDPASKEQQQILSSATHFNPVDLVCGVRDWQGRPFDLRQYVDEKAVLISQKSKDGKALKALEHPGLWNGAMARWITVFVEVPLVTFNPVKTLNDLLRKEHQPG